MGRSLRRALFALPALLLAAGLALLAFPPSDPAPGVPRIDVSDALSPDDAAGFAKALAPRAFSFPADHGPHPAFRHEWWYYAGNLEGASRRRFGFQLTFFRFALAPGSPARSSAWASSQVYMAHFALTDVGSGRFLPFERFSRPALGLAGAEAFPYRVWLEDWAADGEDGRFLPVRLRAAADGASIDLVLSGPGPVVLRGDRGLSRKGPDPGNASYYYSLPRLEARGVIRVGKESHAVHGLAWIDREWGSGALTREAAGWDWFALQLSDGRDVMYYRLRRRDGSTDPFSAGSISRKAGGGSSLSPAEVSLDVLDRWRSARTGLLYPSRWRMRIPREGLDLEILPILPDQEHAGAVAYWEGAVSVRGTARGEAVGGNGYVELTGYGNGRTPR